MIGTDQSVLIKKVLIREVPLCIYYIAHVQVIVHESLNYGYHSYSKLFIVNWLILESMSCTCNQINQVAKVLTRDISIIRTTCTCMY